GSAPRRTGVRRRRWARVSSGVGSLDPYPGRHRCTRLDLANVTCQHARGVEGRGSRPGTMEGVHEPPELVQRLVKHAKGDCMAGPGSVPDPAVLAVARQAAGLVTDGARVGLGTGRAAAAFVDELGERVRRGLRIVGVATSEATARRAQALGIPIIDLDEDVVLDLTVDGADEVAPNLDL